MALCAQLQSIAGLRVDILLHCFLESSVWSGSAAGRRSCMSWQLKLPLPCNLEWPSSHPCKSYCLEMPCFTTADAWQLMQFGDSWDLACWLLLMHASQAGCFAIPAASSHM